MGYRKCIKTVNFGQSIGIQADHLFGLAFRFQSHKHHVKPFVINAAAPNPASEVAVVPARKRKNLHHLGWIGHQLPMGSY